MRGKTAVVLLLLSLATAAVVSVYTSRPLPSYHLGDIVSSDVIAPTDISIVDEVATRERQETVASQVPPVFDYDPEIAQRSLAGFHQTMDNLGERFRARLQAAFGDQPVSGQRLTSQRYKALVAAFIEENGGVLNIPEARRILSILATHGFTQELQADLAGRLTDMTSRYLLADKEAHRVTGLTLSLYNVRTQNAIMLSSRAVLTVGSARDRLLQELLLTSDILSGREARLVSDYLASLVSPNVSFNTGRTDAARRRAEEQVSPVVMQFKRGRVLARRGDEVSPDLSRRLEALKKYRAQAARPERLLGLLLIMLTLYYALWKFTERNRNITIEGTRAFTLMGLVVVAQVVIIRLGAAAANTLSHAMETSPLNIPMVYEFAIPYTCTALIISLLVGPQAALVCSFVVSLMTGFLGSNVGMAFYVVVSSAAAIYGVQHYSERNAISRIGGIIAGVNLVTALAVSLIGDQELTRSAYMLNAASGVLGGVFSAALASLALPVLESSFGILTDVKLLELSNAELPLLRKLALEAPGTYHHSIMVGALGEAAAKAIGANPLMVRIGSYYHDIGKSLAPQLYIENQGGGPNPHDRLEPRESHQYIVAHILKGMELAKEAGLPKEICDFIPQHHGTRLVHYFYQKAREQAEANGEVVAENDFRYPGPKPQRREAAILMIADSSESSTRSLEDRSPENIRAIITKVCDVILADQQFDECDLTMREITLIRESIVKTVCDLYHRRIAYPGFDVAVASRSRER